MNVLLPPRPADTVVLPQAAQIVVHRDPTPTGYASVMRLGLDATVSPLAAPDVRLSVRDLLGPSERGEGTP